MYQQMKSDIEIVDGRYNFIAKCEIEIGAMSDHRFLSFLLNSMEEQIAFISFLSVLYVGVCI